MAFWIRTLISLGVVALLLVWVGCASKPNEPRSTVAERLNGENYDSTVAIMAVPIGDRKSVQKKVSGRVYCGDGLSQRPSAHALVSLNCGTKIQVSTSTDVDGRYGLSVGVQTEKACRLSVRSVCGQALKDLSLIRDEELREQDFFIK